MNHTRVSVCHCEEIYVWIAKIYQSLATTFA